MVLGGAKPKPKAPSTPKSLCLVYRFTIYIHLLFDFILDSFINQIIFTYGNFITSAADFPMRPLYATIYRSSRLYFMHCSCTATS